MSTLAQNPAFMAYAVASVILCLHVIGVTLYTDAVRRSARQEGEDSRRSTRSIDRRELDAPQVGRAQRAQLQALSATVLFVVLGLTYALLGAPAMTARIYFGAFVFATLLHTFGLTGKRQIIRALAYSVGLLTSIGLMTQIGLILLKK